MKLRELLRYQIEISKQLTVGLLADMQDAPLTAPTPNGGNHPLWITGHLTYSEANLVHHIMLGETNPLLDWKDLFGRGSEPSTDESIYPSMEEVLTKWEEVRQHTLQILDGLSEEDFEKPSANPPAGREALFDTYAKVITLVGQHPLLHRGQVADARRAAGRVPLMS